jgi:adenylate cyclase class 2
MRVVKQEIEVKLRVADAAAMRRLLRQVGGRAVRRVHEMNTLFDTPQATLRKRGQLLRLREETTRMGKSQTRYVLTFKGPARRERERRETPAPSAPLPSASLRASGTSGSRRYVRYKVREEAEFIVGDPRAFLAVAGPAGMRPSFRYEKYRTSYSVPGAGGVHVEFDETPVGVFLELEGPRRAIDRMARRLGYSAADYITRSYAALHFEGCRRRGQRAGDMVFGARKK